MLHQRALLTIAAAGLALSCGAVQGTQETRAVEPEPLAIFDLEITRSRSTGESEALSFQLENLTDKSILAYVLRLTDESTGVSWDSLTMIHGRPPKEPGQMWRVEGMKPPRSKGINMSAKGLRLSLSTEMAFFSDGSNWGGESHPRKLWEISQMLIGRGNERFALQILYKRRGVEALTEELMRDAPAAVQALEARPGVIRPR